MGCSMDLLVAISKLVIDALGLIEYNEVLDFISYEVFNASFRE